MRGNLIGFVLTVFLIVFACKKQKDCGGPATIVRTAPCNSWGIEANGQTYPSRNIPDQFKQAGLAVCAQFTVYDDPALCVCCGGKWADILSVEVAP